MQPGEIIRQRRLANGLTQQQLAIRSGSTQAAISRLERGQISPTFHTFELLLTVMGEEAALTVRRSEAEYDRARLQSLRARSPAERLTQAIGWNLLAGRFAQEGRRARPSGGSAGRDGSEPEILRVLDEHRVDYIVIGGLAVQSHGHPRTTQDLDLIPEPSPANLARLGDALSALGARPVGATRQTSAEIPATGVLELDTDAGGVDVHLDPPGAAPYAALRARALQLQLGVTVLVAGRDDLIAMKRASGRPTDRSDLLALTEP